MNDLVIGIFGDHSDNKRLFLRMINNENYDSDTFSYQTESFHKEFEHDFKKYLIEFVVIKKNIEELIINSNSIKNFDSFILLFSLNDINSLEQISNFCNLIIKIKDTKNIPCILCGNNFNNENNSISIINEGIELSSKYGLRFFEIIESNIPEILETIIDISLENKKKISNVLLSSTEKKNCVIN